MRIIDCIPRSEEWDRWRCRPTASEFSQFITPARGEYAAGATDYASKVVMKRLGLDDEPPPSYWMEWGVEMEPSAKRAYAEHTGYELVEAGFVLPDHTDAYGGSPDALVEPDGLLEVKCPNPRTLGVYHARNELPVQYKPQIQGLLLITGRAWCDFWVWHPQLKPFLLRVEPDLAYQAKIADGLLKPLEEIALIEEKLSWKP